MIDPNSSPARMHPRSVVSTFSGCGGSSLGYRTAGMKVLLAVELDEHAVQTYRTNFPNTPVFAGDIHNLTSAEVLERIGLKVGELDVLDGSPPCQVSRSPDFASSRTIAIACSKSTFVSPATYSLGCS